MSNGKNLQPLPLSYVLSSPRFWETRDQHFPGSLSLSRSRGREGEDPGNEVGHKFESYYASFGFPDTPSELAIRES